MKQISFFNNAENYSNMNADCGYNRDRLPEEPAFAVQDNEAVVELKACGYTPYEKICAMLDEKDLVIIAETARSKYLTSLQQYQYLGLRGIDIKRQNITKRLEKLKNYHLLRAFEVRRSGAENGIRFYSIGSLGIKLAQEQGVIFHKGNQMPRDEHDDAETSKRIFSANMSLLGMLRNGADIKGFAFNETIRPLREGSITDGCILRTPGMFWLDDESVFLLEVVRSAPHAFRKLADKIQRYYTLVNNPAYLEANAHGHKAMPQMVICAETFEQSLKLDAYLRSRGIWSEKDTLLYTHDLLYMKDTLRLFYELKEDGTPVWYSLPSRFDRSEPTAA
ncbi:MAG: hypothetical protein Q4F28_10785 [Eubacteriales bacterium]|nr:hypothetical protein [Eubacteriales bacterium]